MQSTTHLQKLISISESEMVISTREEIEATIVSEKGEDYYKELISLPVDQMDNISLAISYDRSGQKRASGNSYSSILGHAFVISMRTDNIIQRVIYSVSLK